MYEAREETTATGWGISVLQDMKFLPLYAFLNCISQCHDMESNEEKPRGERPSAHLDHTSVSACACRPPPNLELPPLYSLRLPCSMATKCPMRPALDKRRRQLLAPCAEMRQPAITPARGLNTAKRVHYPTQTQPSAAEEFWRAHNPAGLLTPPGRAHEVV